ncbi:Pentatricopeptide repeat-containing protein [Rhynchospora pubera]|uniref:Pentatricopeptide repeat-containing protein n=1 Tax=Rhynchospora pubera TaxID=906938 RepID=A0AAV8HQW7_9POAL|nr:Pentatricopeptide repeat-containing protein [Rhynchospora pubera]
MLSKYYNRTKHLQVTCQRWTTLRALKQIHAVTIVNGFLSDPSILRELILASAISIPGAMHYAYKLFDRIPQPDLFIWNTMIRGASRSPTPSQSVYLYVKMVRAGNRPDYLTFPFLLRACTSLSAPCTGTQFHGAIVKLGFESDMFVRNTLINMHANIGDLAIANYLFNNHGRNDVVAWSAMVAGYARRGKLETAQEFFDRMPEKDSISWNVMITAYSKNGEMKKSFELFNQTPWRDSVSWNAVISGYVKCGSHKKALELFDRMHQAGVRPDNVTILSLLTSCAYTGSLDLGQKLHHFLLESFSRKGLPIKLGNAIIDMYSKCGYIEKALEVFDNMEELDISSWNSVICGLALNGHASKSLKLFEEMLKRKVQPDKITFVGILASCSHSGMVNKGREYFDLMQNKYRIEPHMKHYGCMVDMLGRAGFLKEAYNFVKEMKIEPNVVIWRTLLGACRMHGDVELGQIANRELLRVKSAESGNYVLLSNIYASIGEWRGAHMVRNLMDTDGVHKEAGRTLLDGDKKDRIISNV